MCELLCESCVKVAKFIGTALFCVCDMSLRLFCWATSKPPLHIGNCGERCVKGCLLRRLCKIHSEGLNREDYVCCKRSAIILKNSCIRLSDSFPSDNNDPEMLEPLSNMDMNPETVLSYSKIRNIS